MKDSFLRRRLWRKLESLPDGQLYQVLDYVEFLEKKYGEETAEPDRIQRFAESVQDRLRARRAAPWAMKGVMGALSVVDQAVGTAARAARGLADELAEVRGGREPEEPEEPAEGSSTRIVVD